MDNKHINQGVVCEVRDCYYHTTGNECSADRIEVCNCEKNADVRNDTICSTYREKL